MENPSPTLSSVTFAPVWMRVGVRPARESCAVSAIVKHPAWAAPINSSGVVAAWPSSNRDLNEYGPSKAPLPTLSRPLPSARLPFHSASAFRVGMEPPFALPPFSVSLFDALLDLLGREPVSTGAYLAVDVHDLVVRLFGLIRQRSQRLLDAGVVEGTIEPAESRQRPSDHRLDIALFRDVGLDEDRFAARRFDLGDDGIAFCLAASADDDLCALFGKRDCGRTANPSIAASDQGDFPRKLTHAVLHGLSFPQLSCRPGSAAGRRDLEERAPIRRHRCRSLGSTMRLGASGPRPTVPLAHLARRSTPAAQGESTSTLEGVERAHITRVLEEMNWMLGGPRGAAARLGMKRTTLQSLMKRLDRPGDGPDEARGTVGRFSEMIRPPVPIMV